MWGWVGLSSRRRDDGAREPGDDPGPPAATRSPPASLDRHQNPEQGPVTPTRGETHQNTGSTVPGARSTAPALAGRLPPGAGRRPGPGLARRVPHFDVGRPRISASGCSRAPNGIAGAETSTRATHLPIRGCRRSNSRTNRVWRTCLWRVLIERIASVYDVAVGTTHRAVSILVESGHAALAAGAGVRVANYA